MLLFARVFVDTLHTYLGGENTDSARRGVGKAGLGSILLHGEHDLFEPLLRDPHSPISMKRAGALRRVSGCARKERERGGLEGEGTKESSAVY